MKKFLLLLSFEVCHQLLAEFVLGVVVVVVAAGGGVEGDVGSYPNFVLSVDFPVFIPAESFFSAEHESVKSYCSPPMCQYALQVILEG